MAAELRMVRVVHNVRITEKPERGSATMHPVLGLVLVISGDFQIDGRISNFSHYQVILPDGTLDSVDHSGYGWRV